MADLGELIEARDSLRADRRRLTDELQAIEAQLAERNRLDPQTGERQEGDDYWAWRSAAVRAKTHKAKELRDVKALISQVQIQLDENASQPGTGAKRVRYDRLEAKIDLLLEHFGLTLETPDRDG